MRMVGWSILILGAGWFILSCVTGAVLWGMEALTGVSPSLPRAGNIEWAGALVYFGFYFGSWVLMIVGGAFLLAASLIRRAWP